MIINLRHIAISVADIRVGINFYCGLGARLVSQDEESGEFISHFIGVPNCKLLSAKLHLDDGSRLELIQFMEPYPPDGQSPTAVVSSGIHHLAFTVNDIYLAISLVQNLGGSLVSEPLDVPQEHSVHARPAPSSPSVTNGLSTSSKY